MAGFPGSPFFFGGGVGIVGIGRAHRDPQNTSRRRIIRHEADNMEWVFFIVVPSTPIVQFLGSVPPKSTDPPESRLGVSPAVNLPCSLLPSPSNPSNPFHTLQVMLVCERIATIWLSAWSANIACLRSERACTPSRNPSGKSATMPRMPIAMTKTAMLTSISEKPALCAACFICFLSALSLLSP